MTENWAGGRSDYWVWGHSLRGGRRLRPLPPPPEDGKLRIIFFGAHPDDCEYTRRGRRDEVGRAGHHVKLVSATNGDIGHWQMAGGPLASAGAKPKSMEVGRMLGITTEVLDIHDGEFLPTLENRRTFTRLIREWNADIVISQPAQRLSSRPPLHVHPRAGLGLYGHGSVLLPRHSVPQEEPRVLLRVGSFQKPNPFKADVAVGIDEVIEPTLDALLVMGRRSTKAERTAMPASSPTIRPENRSVGTRCGRGSRTSTRRKPTSTATL